MNVATKNGAAPLARPAPVTGGIAPVQDQPNEKRCSQCGVVKPLDDFYRWGPDKSKFYGHCKECNHQRSRERFKQNPEAQQAKGRRYRERHPETLREKGRRYRTENAEKYRAQWMVREAVKSGRLTKPSACEDCGESVRRRLLHGHHEDYAKPLEVRWLCPRCHVAAHREDFVAQR